MTFPFTPIVTAAQLGTYLNDSSIDVVRAEMMIDLSQVLCTNVVNPLPDGAEVVVLRVAARAYTSIVSSRQAQLAAGGVQPAPAGLGGGPWLSRADIADLRRMNSGSNAFSINMLPADYAANLPTWDMQGEADGYLEVDSS